MGQQRIKYLFGQYLAGQLSEQEEFDWQELLGDANQQQTLNELAHGIFQRDDLLKYQLDKPKARKILEGILVHPQLNIKQPYALWKRIAAVAAIVIVIFAGLFYYNLNFKKERSSQFVMKNDVASGKFGATLTLGNGNEIMLSDLKTGVVIEPTKFSYDDYSAVIQNGENSLVGIQQLTAATKRGQTYTVTLPDGTKVWLNADSKVGFPSQFSGKQRSVSLEGEAYFEVARDKLRPFIVKSKMQTTEVLGTHFNISAYKDREDVTTTLVEGSVWLKNFSVRGRVSEVVLKPNQQAKLSESVFRVGNVVAEDAIAWKNGYFNFNDQKIQDIMQIIARWYDIEVSYEGNVTTDGFNGKISRFKNISQVLKLLEDTKLVHFKVEGRRVIVKE
jgi:transmembrane sensor